jgi:phosphopantetheinyl transferase
VSISHSHGWAAAAVHRGIDPLGCDLERVEARSAAFREDYFTAREQAFVAAAPTDEAPLRATLVWSAKEAVMKALGQGLRLPPAAVRVLPSPLPACGAGWRSFSVLAPFAAVTLRGSWRVVGGFVLTVAGGRDDPRLAGAMLDAERRADPTSCLAPFPWP